MNPALLGWALLAAVLGMVGAGGAGAWYGYSSGHTNGAAEVQKDWDHAKALGEARKERDSEHAAGIDTSVTAFLANLEKQYARSSLAKGLAKRVTCPPSGVVGDVVLPAELLDGMFNRPAPAVVDPAASASR